MKKIKVLMVAAELTPVVKVGGLGDVVGALPKALVQLGCETKIALPYYGSIDSKKYHAKNIAKSISVAFGGKIEKIDLWSIVLPGSQVEVWLVKHAYFSPKEVYLCNIKEYRNEERFAFFSLAVLEASKHIGWRPDVIHCHDWHTSLVPLLLKTSYKTEPFFAQTRTLLTIHNLAMQGQTKAEIAEMANLDKKHPTVKADLTDGNINLMYQGIMNADLVNTVSPTYAKEILTKDQGANLEKYLKIRKKDSSGILNGIDTGLFDPSSDKLIKKRYSSASLRDKTANKLALQKEVGLPQAENTALVGTVSRFTSQKGLDLIDDRIAALPCQFVFLGTGQKEFEDELTALAKKYPDKFNVQVKFDAGLAQRIYAASDIFLMPSLFEPCGLGQMIAMRYGSVPVVRATGGLADTVDARVGFSFKKYSSKVLCGTLKAALDVYKDRPKTWSKLQSTGMKRDFSWTKSAKDYAKLYKKLASIK